MPKANKHRGSSFDEFLREQELYEDVQAATLNFRLAASQMPGLGTGKGLNAGG